MIAARNFELAPYADTSADDKSLSGLPGVLPARAAKCLSSSYAANWMAPWAVCCRKQTMRAAVNKNQQLTAFMQRIGFSTAHRASVGVDSCWMLDLSTYLWAVAGLFCHSIGDVLQKSPATAITVMTSEHNTVLNGSQNIICKCNKPRDSAKRFVPH